MPDQPIIIVPQFHYGLPDIYDDTPWSDEDIADLRAAMEHGSTPEEAAGHLCRAVADHGLDGGSTSQFAFDRAEDAALLSRGEDAAWILRIMAAVTLVDVGALDSRSR